MNFILHEPLLKETLNEDEFALLMAEVSLQTRFWPVYVIVGVFVCVETKACNVLIMFIIRLHFKYMTQMPKLDCYRILILTC